MKRMLLAALAVLASAQSPSRIASDFEIAKMEQQLARSHDFLAQLSGHLNLGDLRAARNETRLAREEYRKSLAVASDERIAARRNSDMTRYSTATSYAALAAAKLGDAEQTLELSDEALRYTSDSAKTWNLRASAFTALGLPRKAASAARNAVTIAAAEPQSVANTLDLAIYEHALATALIDDGQNDEAERLLGEVVATLRLPLFAPLQREVARNESFEVYSSARGEAAAYISLRNRAQLRLAALYEKRGAVENAATVYRDVLATRSDDATALAGLARLAKTNDDRDRYFADAFDANPFSMPLVREYQRAGAPGAIDDSTTGGRVRKALREMQRHETRAAEATLAALLRDFPANDTLQTLAREAHAESASASMPQFANGTATAAELRAMLILFASDRLTPDERKRMDALTLTNEVSFDAPLDATEAGTTVFASGTMAGVPFAFSEPIAFHGTFSAASPLRLTYRILGATRHGDEDALLLEPVKLEAAR